MRTRIKIAGISWERCVKKSYRHLIPVPKSAYESVDGWRFLNLQDRTATQSKHWTCFREYPLYLKGRGRTREDACMMLRHLEQEAARSLLKL